MNDIAIPNIEDATRRIEAAERELKAAKDALAKAKASDLETIVEGLPIGAVFRTGPNDRATTIRFFKFEGGRIVSAYGRQYASAAAFAENERRLARSKVYIVKGDDENDW